MTKNNLALAAIVIIAIAISSWAFKPSFDISVGGPSSFGALTGGTITTPVQFLENMTVGFSKASTTSATTYTLTANDLGNQFGGYQTVFQTLSGGAATFTLPASSTIANIAPRAGMRTTQCWVSITNNITFAAGTGIDLDTASTSATDLTFLAGKGGCLEFVRQTDSDLHVWLTEYN